VHIACKSAWATEPQPPDLIGTNASMPPLNMQDYYDFVYALADRYWGKIARYSIENEAAAPTFWGGSAEEYAALLGTAYQAVKAADPGAIVVNDGLSSTGLTFMIAADMFQAGLEQEAVDYMNAAYANFAPGRRGDNPLYADSPEELGNMILSDLGQRYLSWMPMEAALQASMDAFQIHYYAPPRLMKGVMDWVKGKLLAQGPGLPFEVWELGYGWDDVLPLDVIAQARAVPMLLATAVGEGATFVEYWRWTDASELEGTGVTGLVTAQGPRPGAYALGDCAPLLNGTLQSQPLDAGPGVAGYKFWNGAGPFVIVWRSEPGSGTVSLPMDGPTVSVKNLVTQGVSQADPAAVPLGEDPLLITP
jgi:hypothetical protein